jgi:predicted nucleic acid-binding protein
VKFAVDSSLLVRLYLRDSNTDSLERFLAEDGKVLSVSELARVEVLNVLLRLEQETAEFLADLNEGTRFRLERLDWRDAFQQAESLARRFSRTLKPGGHDLVLVAAATVSGATWFLSFDANSCQRPLAACAGLRVWPPLDRDEKGLVRHAGRQTSG